MALPHLTAYFEDFLSEIRLTPAQRSALIEAHTTLRDRLGADEHLSGHVTSTFLQGSYKRSTIIKPSEGQASDVDVVVVTDFDESSYTPSQALDAFVPFLEEYYCGMYEKQGRSWGIHLPDADMDLVPTSAPSEAQKACAAMRHLELGATVEELTNERALKASCASVDAASLIDGVSAGDDWKDEPLRIPDREAHKWEDTDPISQINWTLDKNRRTDGHYVNVVKAIKWWWRTKHPDKKYPKGYPLEHLVGDCCPDGIASVAEGVVSVFERIASDYSEKPYLADRGLPGNDVMARVSEEDYARFHDAVAAAALIAREAFDAQDERIATERWRDLFGEEFPLARERVEKAAFTKRAAGGTTLAGGRFA